MTTIIEGFTALEGLMKRLQDETAQTNADVAGLCGELYQIRIDFNNRIDAVIANVERMRTERQSAILEAIGSSSQDAMKKADE